MLELTKALNADWTSGTWRAYKGLDGKRKAYMFDPNGDGLSLANHAINQDGIVQPSVVCQLCGFHDTVRLLNW